jgi:hypothetical protein
MACTVGRMPLRRYADILADAEQELVEPSELDRARLSRGPVGVMSGDDIVPGSDFFFCGKNLKPEFMPVCACGIFADFLCDYPMAGGKTCDAPLCEEHRHPIRADMDFCLVHFAEFRGKSGRSSLGVWPPARGEKA